jgi:hypothetical protein
MNLIQVRFPDHSGQMLKGIEIHNHWSFHSCAYGEKEEKEEPYQMPETTTLSIMKKAFSYLV